MQKSSKKPLPITTLTGAFVCTFSVPFLRYKTNKDKRKNLCSYLKSIDFKPFLRRDKV